MKNRTCWLQACGSLFFLSLAVALTATGFSGCGGGKKKTETAGNNKKKSGSKKPGDRGGNPLIAQNDGSRRGVWNKNGRKYYNNHPYDIWYPNAYQVAADQRPVGSNGNGGDKQPMGNGTKNPPATKKQTPQSSNDWKSIAPIAALVAEVKRIRNAVSQKTNTIGRYRGNLKEIAYNGATLAAVAHIISLHPDSVTWKKDALYVRDLGMKINESATGLAKKNYDATKLAVEQFVEILGRNKPAGLKAPAKDAEFFDFAERAGIMKRMSAAFDRMNKDINNEAKFKSAAEEVVQEATILGLLAKFAGDSSYDQAEEAGYQKHVAATVKATQQIRAAVQGQNFASFRAGIDIIQNNCNECHLNFKNN